MLGSEKEREQLLDLVCARLQEVMRTNSHAPVLEPEAVAEAQLLAGSMAALDPDMSAWHALGWLHWLRYEALGEESGLADRTTAAEKFLPCFLFGEDNIPAPLLIELAEKVAPGASRLLARAIDSDDAELAGRCVVVWRAIVGALLDGHRLRGIALSSLGQSLLLRHGHTREPGDLDEAIALGREAMRCQASADERSGFLHNLGLAFQVRFEETRDLASLVEAVTAHRDAVAIAPPDSPILTILLSGLATAQMVAHDRAGDIAHLDATIDLLRAVLNDTVQEDPHRPGRLFNVSVMLQKRYDLLRTFADLDEAVISARAAVEITPRDHTRLPVYLARLADALHGRFEHTGNAADLGDSILAARRAVELTPAGHPQSVERILSLAAALCCEGRRSGRDELEVEAARLYASAAETTTARPSHRVLAARNAAALLARSDLARGRELLEAAVHLLPEVVPLELTRADHRHVFGSLANLAGDAAALTLADHSISEGSRALRALGLLEAGRAVVLGARFDLRGELVDLRRRHPELAARFIAARDSLDRPEWPFVATVDRHLLVDELRAALTGIRAQAGFESFGRPPELSDLAHEGGEGPVVAFNTSRHRCDALVVTTDGVRAVALPGMTLESLIQNFSAFYDALDTPEEPVVLPAVLEWLWDNAVEPVLTTLGYDGGSEEVRRVWWAPGGVLGLLPLHAAGHHSDPPDDPDRRTALDRVVSSYTPSVRALRHARMRGATRPPIERALIVAMPTTPGFRNRSLPSAATEAERVRRLVPESVLLMGDPITGFTSGGPTKAAVLENLAECPIAHFICHARADPVEPSRSVLLLHDTLVSPLTVAALDEVKLDHAYLAYLSACTTAAGHNAALIDESTHLAAAFQLAGFPHVVGTLWEVGDRPAVRMAEQFYRALTAEPGGADPALALHRAVHVARARYPKCPSAWSSHQHFGA